MSKHTPGPWNIGTKNGARVWSENGETLIADADASESLRKEIKKANARLIAAAPTILQKLILAREYIAACIQSHAETATNPTTGLVDDPDDVLALEADQDLLNGIDAAIAQATEAA